MGYRRGYYKKDGTYVQGHFTSTTRKTQGSKSKNKIGCLSMPLFTFTLIFLISCATDDSNCIEMSCRDFANQAEAQQTFYSNPDWYGNLDADNDKIACENVAN